MLANKHRFKVFNVAVQFSFILSFFIIFFARKNKYKFFTSQSKVIGYVRLNYSDVKASKPVELMLALLITFHFVGNKAKQRISKRVFQGKKASQIFRNKNIFYPLIRTRTVVFKLLWRYFQGYFSALAYALNILIFKMNFNLNMLVSIVHIKKGVMI